MSLQSIGGLMYWPDKSRSASAGSSQAMTDVGGRYGSVLQIPKTGNISKIVFRTVAVATPQTLRVGLYTVDSSGNPTSSQYGGSAYGTQSAPAANTTYAVSLATPAAVTAGDDAAPIIEFDSTTGNVQFLRAATTPLFCAKPNTVYYNGASWAKTISPPNIGLEYDDGSYADYGGMLTGAGINASVKAVNSATYDESALAFTLPFSARCVGMWALMIPGSGADFEANLYSGTTVIAQKVVDGDYVVTGGAAVQTDFRFTAPYTLAANTLYRVGLRPTTTTTITWYDFQPGSAARLGSWPLGTNGYWSRRLDQGSWTDDTARRPFFGLILDQIDYSAGGLLRHPGMAGGMRG